MKIQSLSVVVPAKRCINNCKFCVSKMHESEFEDFISTKTLYRDLYKKDYINRLEFARDNGCNTVMLTGDCEPLQNWTFLEKFGDYNKILEKPFRIIELQTVGNLLNRDMLYFLRHHVGVTTISLSISDLWDNVSNCQIIGCDTFSTYELCKDIKKYGFNLRLSLNLTDYMLPKGTMIRDLLSLSKDMRADQVTLRRMYIGEELTKERKWLLDHRLEAGQIVGLNTFILNLPIIDKLEYGRSKRIYEGISIVYDDDCMATKIEDVAKYLILRPNCKLYSRWETKGSLIF